MSIHRWVTVVASVLVVGSNALAQDHAKNGKAGALPFTVSKETTGILSPVLEDGTPDYVRAMNEKYGKDLKAEENAFARWLKVGATKETVPDKVRTEFLKMCGVAESEGMKWVPYWEYLRDQGMQHATIGLHVGEEIRAAGRLWDENDFPKLAEFLGARKAYLDASVDAMGARKYWVPMVAGDGHTLNSVTSPGGSLPGVERFRTTLATLGQRATMKMKGGDFDGFMTNVKLLERIGREMQKAGTLKERLAGMTTHGMMSRVIGAAAGSGKLTQAQCVKLWEFMEAMGEHGTIEETVDVERRWLILERAVLIALGKAELLKRGEAYASYDRMMESIQRDEVDWDAALRQINREIDEEITQIRKSTIKQLLEREKETEKSWSNFFEGDGNCAKKNGESREEYTARIAHAFVMTMGINLKRCELTKRESKMQRDMARTMVAVAGYYADRNQWPETLASLKPGYMKDIPRDIYSQDEKEEFLFAKSDSGARVYSVGTNGKDDGGVKDDPYAWETVLDDIVIGAGVDAK